MRAGVNHSKRRQQLFHDGLRKWGGGVANVHGVARATGRLVPALLFFFLINKNSHFLCSDFPSWVPTQNVLSPRVPLAYDSFSDFACVGLPGT